MLKSMQNIVLGFAILNISACAETETASIQQTQPSSRAYDTVLAKKKTTDHFWTPRETPVLGDYPELANLPEDSLSKYGGWIGKRFVGNGFFRTEKQNGIWWMVDPEGYPFFSVGLNAVEPGVEATSNEKKLRGRFFGAHNSIEDWAVTAGTWLDKNGFNTLGSWSDWRTLNDDKHSPVPYTEQLHLLTHFVWKDKKVRGGDEFKFKWMLYYILDPEFPIYCAQKMEKVAQRTKDDPYLIGYFTDNELGMRVNQLDRFLGLEVDDPVREKVLIWLTETRGVNPSADGTWNISQEDRKAFYRYLVKTYYEIVTRAVRDADPNHLILGDRYNYDQQDNPLIWNVANDYIDVFSYNWYHVWNPNENRDIENWARWTDKPVIITEWYAKGLDTGMKNDTGAGWIVSTQEERGKFYETFALGLLDDPSVVGFHWFRYRDNNVDAAHLVDWSNRDSNKGFLDVDYNNYEPLVKRARDVNKRVYGIRNHLIQQR